MAIYKHRYEGTLPLGTNFGFGWWSETSEDITLVQAAAVQWLTDFWSATVAAFYSTDFSFSRIATALINQSDGKQIDLREDVVTQAGSGTGVSLMGDAAVVISLRTDTTARVGRGRTYIPGGLTSCITGDGRVDNGYIAALLAGLDTAWTGYNVLRVPSIYSRTDRQMRAITKYDIGDLWDTQRRRERKAAETRTSATMPLS